MSLRTLALAAVGLVLVAVSHEACMAVVVWEHYEWWLVAVSVAALAAGSGPLALAIFRLWNRGARGAWPSVEQSPGLAGVGMVLTLGSSGSCYVLGDGKLDLPLLATFFVGVAFTIGALMLLAWALAAHDDLRR